MTVTRTAHPQLIGIFGVGLLLFGLVIVNRCVASDWLVCNEGTCSLDRKVPVPFGSLQPYHRTVRAQDIKKLEPMSYEAKSGDTEYLVTFRGEGEDETVNLRFHLDAAGAGDARRYFADPKGRLELVGPRRTRDYPFAAMILGLSAAAFLAAFKEWKKQRGAA